jgi:hypothetical protein
MNDNDAPPPHDTQSFSITEGAWKLIHNEKRPADLPEFELYDAANDPLDRHDVAGSHPEIVSRLSAALAAWKTKAEAARIAVESGTKQDIAPEDLERLRSLGYVR